MDAKDSLKMVLDALHELKKQHIDRQTLIDFVSGNESRDIIDSGLDKEELFGCCDKRDETHIGLVVDQALEEKFTKAVGTDITITPKGEHWRKDPQTFLLKEEEEEKEPDDNALLDSIAENALRKPDEEEDDDTPLPVVITPATPKSQQMIQLIQAIDRKIPLDDYAEQNQLDFDDVLDNLEHLIERGTKLDITYFTDEVLGKECLDELFDYFDEVDGDVERTIDEFDSIYQPEEIRLARLVWKK